MWLKIITFLKIQFPKFIQKYWNIEYRCKLIHPFLSDISCSKTNISRCEIKNYITQTFLIIQKSSEHLIHDLWEYFAKQSSLHHFVCNNLHNFLQAKASDIISSSKFLISLFNGYQSFTTIRPSYDDQFCS